MTYDKYVEIGNLCELMLGNAAGCHIQINDEIIQNEYALLTAASGEYYLSAPSQRLALYKNGYKAAAGTAVKISDSDFFSIALDIVFVYWAAACILTEWEKSAQLCLCIQ